MADISVTLFGPLDTMVGPYIEYVLLVLAVATIITRKLAHSTHVEQAAEGDGDEEISRHPVHVVTMWALVLGSLYYLTLHHHSGMVLSVLVLGTFIADFFEFESRKVEARNDFDIEAPKGAIVASLITLLYAAYVSLFFLIKPFWNAIV